MNTCIDMGLFLCSNCHWGRKYRCIVEEYESKLSPNYIKEYILQYSTRSKNTIPYYANGVFYTYDMHHKYFLAALQRNPKMLTIYKKLMILL
jgi:hypothetical protein